MKNNITGKQLTEGERKDELEKLLVVGAKIKVGKKYAEENSCVEGEVWELIEGSFDYDNGLYTETQTAPSLWTEDSGEYDSIYHLFGNNLENFMDCELLPTQESVKSENQTIDKILEDFGCPHIPFDENVTMYYPAIVSAMQEYSTQQTAHLQQQLKEAKELILQLNEIIENRASPDMINGI